MRSGHLALPLAMAIFAACGNAAAADKASTWAHCWGPYQVPAAAIFHIDNPQPPTAKAGKAPLARLFTRQPVKVAKDGATVTQAVGLGGELALAEAGGEVVLLADELLLSDDAGARYLLPRSERFVLVPQAGTRFSLEGTLRAKADGGMLVNRTGPGSAALILPFDAELQVPARIRPYTPDDPSDSLRSETLPSAETPGTLRLRASKPGVDLSENRGKLRACIAAEDGTAKMAVIEEVTPVTEAGDVVDIVVKLPAEFRTYLGDVESPWIQPASVAVMSTDGSFFGQSDFWITGWRSALAVGLIAIVVFAFLSFYLSKEKDMLIGWFVGAGNKASISLFQIFIWTLVTFLGLTYVAVLTGELFAISEQVLMLLGIAGAGSVAARFVAVGKGRAPGEQEKPKYADMFQTDGVFDLYKLQIFLFTVGIAIYVAFRIAIDFVFPELDTNLLLLLGISNGVYVGAKAASGESPFRVAERLDAELKTLEEAKLRAEGEIARFNAEISRLSALPAPTAKDTADKTLLEKSKEREEARLKSLVEQIATATAARKKAIESL